MPDRLPSLVLLVGFWIPPAMAGWAAAGHLERSAVRDGARRVVRALAAFVVVYAAGWFLLNLAAMPPYIPGSTMDPRSAPPEAVAWLAVVAGALILPGSALACAWAFRRRRRLDGRPGSAGALARPRG
jgi:biotin transporter BioY